MAISIRSRIRNALVGLTLFLCACFVGLVFLIAFVIEDQIFINQLEIQQNALEAFLSKEGAINQWSSEGSAFSIVVGSQGFSLDLAPEKQQRIASSLGVHEYFDDDRAGFISHFKHPMTGASVFLKYDVSPYLAVRGSKQPILIFLVLLSASILVATIWISRRLARTTLRPVNDLINSLDNNHAITELTQKFDDDEIGVLAKSLAHALQRVQKTVQREHEFNQGVSHELRSPIQVAQSSVELMLYKHQDKTPPELLRLDRAIKQMNEITDAFLLLVSDRQDLNNRCDVMSLVKMCEETAANNKIVWHLNVSQQHSYSMPESALKVVLRGLLTNAFAHGDADIIDVAFNQDRLVVSNSYSPNGEHKTYSGFGLGQSIAQRLCEYFSCSLKFKNDPLEKQFSATVVFG